MEFPQKKKIRRLEYSGLLNNKTSTIDLTIILRNLSNTTTVVTSKARTCFPEDYLFPSAPEGEVSIPDFRAEGGGFDPPFSGAKRTKIGVCGAEGAGLKFVSEISIKLLRKKAINSDFLKKSGSKFSSKMGLVNRLKNGEKIKNVLENLDFGKKLDSPGGRFRSPFSVKYEIGEELFISVLTYVTKNLGHTHR